MKSLKQGSKDKLKINTNNSNRRTSSTTTTTKVAAIAQEIKLKKRMNNVVFVSFLVLTISISHFGVGVSGQYVQYNANAQENQSVADRRIDTATEYEYYDDVIEDISTTQSLPTTTTTKATTTTTTTSTSKPITSSYRILTTHRNAFRPSNFKKKFDVTTKQYHADSYTEASNENAFVQKEPNQSKQYQQQPPQQQQLAPPHLRNAIADINRRTSGKEYAQEKSSSTSIDSNNVNGSGNYFSRRYARFLFKLRTG
ncbi:cAMP-dependent protein kinase catalytic subunit-like [Contarinia nasturtii]|uniref:cAMP-dependent protein kinase catalytic subunit-like n=1 Tax=Contarinia nasturtii TaxID=265458 RepID=UPI0012D46168|nr:cAMP-dependent protein kinase catalytic subunit-like [Contarinia nasturtii]XP_031635881.1 cAMP-dependent protein kinase catalytic subunit-like [Contarinia nasturtii]XP_031635882.1 cAMP-dependent protein kinase catalytic subunit-like [Contarinia nasturtii]